MRNESKSNHGLIVNLAITIYKHGYLFMQGSHIRLTILVILFWPFSISHCVCAPGGTLDLCVGEGSRRTLRTQASIWQLNGIERRCMYVYVCVPTSFYFCPNHIILRVHLIDVFDWVCRCVHASLCAFLSFKPNHMKPILYSFLTPICICLKCCLCVCCFRTLSSSLLNSIPTSTYFFHLCLYTVCMCVHAFVHI